MTDTHAASVRRRRWRSRKCWRRYIRHGQIRARCSQKQRVWRRPKFTKMWTYLLSCHWHCNVTLNVTDDRHRRRRRRLRAQFPIGHFSKRSSLKGIQNTGRAKRIRTGSVLPRFQNFGRQPPTAGRKGTSSAISFLLLRIGDIRLRWFVSQCGYNTFGGYSKGQANSRGLTLRPNGVIWWMLREPGMRVGDGMILGRGRRNRKLFGTEPRYPIYQQLLYIRKGRGTFSSLLTQLASEGLLCRPRFCEIVKRLRQWYFL